MPAGPSSAAALSARRLVTVLVLMHRGQTCVVNLVHGIGNGAFVALPEEVSGIWTTAILKANAVRCSLDSPIQSVETVLRVEIEVAETDLDARRVVVAGSERVRRNRGDQQRGHGQKRRARSRETQSLAVHRVPLVR